MTRAADGRAGGPTGRRHLLPGPYDLAVVGGGINGAAIAYDAARRGKSVVLLEKDDFAQGTSSRSSKMLHGGIRYLEQLRLGLVFEALRERELLLRLAPHLTSVQSFVIPVYAGAPRGPKMIRLGLFLYDLLTFGRGIGKSRFMTKEEVLERVPGLLQEGLLGGGLYHDVVMDDARLCLANVIAAAETDPAGVRVVIRNYTEVREIKPGSPNFLAVRDRVTRSEQQVAARHVVRALGPWTEPELLVPSKGVHLLLPALPVAAGDRPMKDGLLVTHSKDNRVFFVIPWCGRTVVGTTETPFDGSLDDLRVEPGEVRYLLDEVRRHFPKLSLQASDIRGTFAGVRPLARTTSWFGRGRVGLGKVSRVHRIVQEGSVFTVFGGKYTTYRRIARDVLDRVFPGSACTTDRHPLPGGEAGPWERFLQQLPQSRAAHPDHDELKRLYQRYGARLDAVLRLAESDEALSCPLVEGMAETGAEVVYGIQREFVTYPEDFLSRRTTRRFSRDGGRALYDAVEELIRRHATVIPVDLDEARSRYFAALEWEDRLRRGDAGLTPEASRDPAPRQGNPT